jgi:hypothetical protein
MFALADKLEQIKFAECPTMAQLVAGLPLRIPWKTDILVQLSEELCCMELDGSLLQQFICILGYFQNKTFKIRAIWDVALCSLVGVDRRFRGAYCLHH